MKKLLLSGLLISTAMFAQKDSYLAVSGGLDIKNATLGSDPTGNKPALDWIGQLHIVGANVEIGMGYESFQQIKFGRTFANLGYHFPLYDSVFFTGIKTTLIPSLEASMITRNVNEQYTYNGTNISEDRKYGFMAIGLNLAWHWDLTDKLGVQFVTNVLPRPDLKYIYNTDKTVFSNYFKLIYKFNQN